MNLYGFCQPLLLFIYGKFIDAGSVAVGVLGGLHNVEA